jgi:putative ABC transport system permease protein
VTGTRSANREPRLIAPGGRFPLFQALVVGPIRDHPGRAALAIAAIALGVALGVAVHLINASALNEMSFAAHRLAGEADLVIRGPRGGFDEALYPRIARLPQVEAANPAVEADVAIAGSVATLRIIGFDPLRAAQVQPALLPERRSLVSDLFDPDAILLSPAAAARLGLKTGDSLAIRVGTSDIALRVAGLLPEGAYRQPLGVMDIGAAQWRLARMGRLNRLDLRLKPGTDVAGFRRILQRELPPGVHAVTPDVEAARGADLSRAYRLNLDMLALIALFTGAFLVFSSQVLALLRRRPQFALLRAIGLTRTRLAVLLVAEGAVIGIAGSILGLIAGYHVAAYVVQHFGADLGAGYFRSLAPHLHVDPQALVFYFILGLLFAVLGSAVPALEAARRPPAQALRAGDDEAGVRQLRTAGPGAGLIVLGLLLTLAPPVNGLPVAGYAAIALILIGAVLILPWLALACLRRLPLPRFAPAALAVAQLQATPRQVALGIATIVTSFSLMVAMLIMVHSFRTSLDSWLNRMLPADLYLRAARAGETGFLAPDEQARIAALPALARVEFLRTRNLLLDPARPPVILIARSNPPELLPIIGATAIPATDQPPPVWVSEVAADLYGFRVGERVALPIGEDSTLFTIAGIWRDYAHQAGAIVLERGLYERLTGDRLASEAALWLAPGASPQEVVPALRARLEGSTAPEIASTGEVRAASLALFDRTFAVTYALEIAAVLIGLFGVSVSFGAQALARRREFGVLRHIGMTRREIGAMLGSEGMLVSALGAGVGCVLGCLVSLILVHVVNRHSFHWSMELHIPWLPLMGLALTLITASVATAIWSGRAAMREDVVRAVREDW